MPPAHNGSITGSNPVGSTKKEEEGMESSITVMQLFLVQKIIGSNPIFPANKRIVNV